MDSLFLDLDGTTLNDQKEITPGNRRALETARERGCRIVVTSGRPLASALHQARRLELAGPGCYVIAYNGGVVYDCGQDREVFRRTLELETLFTLFDEAGRRGIHIQTYSGDSVLVEPRCDDEDVRHYCGTIGMEYRVIGDIRQIPEPPVKALCINGRSWEKLDAMRRWSQERCGAHLSCLFSSRSYLEMMPPDVSKGNALEGLCHRLGLSLKSAVAVGDEANDVSMLLAAGTGVAVANAVPEAKAAADYVTERDNNHDAILEVVERFL